MPSDRLPFPPDSLDLLAKARKYLTQQELAQKLAVNRKTISRWENRQIPLPFHVAPALREILAGICERPNPNASFTFIDLFAGVGGIRKGFEAAGGKAVFTSEWNPWAQKTYLANFGEESPIAGDIVGYPVEKIPDHDVLLAGFPCQPFSIAGVSKKNALGRPHGFACATQGTLFFDVARILASKRPKAFLLENVKNLVSHDRGNTFRIILETLRDELGYDIHYRVIDARHFVPQHRERILIAGFREPTGFTFDDLPLPEASHTLRQILHPEDGSEDAEERYTTGPKAKVHSKYTLTNKLWSYLQAYAEKHRLAGNGFGFGLVGHDDVARTLSARYYKDGSEILVRRGKKANPRRLTPRECARLMGFPDSFRIPVSDTQAYKQFGNSVVVPVIQAVAHHMKPHIDALQQFDITGVLQPMLSATA